MFTGIISDVGTITTAVDGSKVRRFGVDSGYAAGGITIGASIAIAGVCLTVVAVRPRGVGVTFEVEAAPETLAVTTASGWRPGLRVNLERSLRIGDPLDGHIVQGHVDGVAEITAREDLGESVRFEFAAPRALSRFIAVKGAVALDGTSLTVNHVAGDHFDCLIIPHTLKVTTWGERRAGDKVNIEGDMMARYAARLMERQ